MHPPNGGYWIHDAPPSVERQRPLFAVLLVEKNASERLDGPASVIPANSTGGVFEVSIARLVKEEPSKLPGASWVQLSP